MKRKTLLSALIASLLLGLGAGAVHAQNKAVIKLGWTTCLLYTSDAADE